MPALGTNAAIDHFAPIFASPPMEAEDNHPELLVPFYGFCLVIFFFYCYPIARWTLRLERRFAVKL